MATVDEASGSSSVTAANDEAAHDGPNLIAKLAVINIFEIELRISC